MDQIQPGICELTLNFNIQNTEVHCTSDLNSDKPQTTVHLCIFCVFVYHQKSEHIWSVLKTFLIGRFPLNRQIFKLDHEWRIQRGIEFKYLSSKNRRNPFLSNRGEIGRKSGGFSIRLFPQHIHLRFAKLRFSSNLRVGPKL